MIRRLIRRLQHQAMLVGSTKPMDYGTRKPINLRRKLASASATSNCNRIA
jgi:hypothetical protein